MKKIKKTNPYPHLLYIDSSTLWFADKRPMVDPKFDTFFETYSGKVSLHLKIPEVVKGELLHQHYVLARKELVKANHSLDSVAKVTNKKYSHRVTPDRVNKEIEKKFGLWVKKCAAEVIETPIESIDWNEIIYSSVFRQGVFEEETDKKKEKGFRDAMIAETVIHYCNNDKSDMQLAFLCKDKLLRMYVESRLRNIKRFSVYEFIEDYQTYLDLTLEEIEEKFVRAIIRRARAKFFNKGDPNSIVYRDDIKSILETSYADCFDNPEQFEDKSSLSKAEIAFSSSKNNWEPMQRGNYWIARPEFIETDDAGIYHWNSIVTYVQHYRRQEAQVSLKELSHIDRILVLPFHIHWKSKVGSDGRFYSYQLEGHEVKDQDFRAPTSEECEKYEIKVEG